jgi:hypothetical protein
MIEFTFIFFISPRINFSWETLYQGWFHDLSLTLLICMVTLSFIWYSEVL